MSLHFANLHGRAKSNRDADKFQVHRAGTDLLLGSAFCRSPGSADQRLGPANQDVGGQHSRSGPLAPPPGSAAQGNGKKRYRGAGPSAPATPLQQLQRARRFCDPRHATRSQFLQRHFENLSVSSNAVGHVLCRSLPRRDDVSSPFDSAQGDPECNRRVVPRRTGRIAACRHLKNESQDSKSGLIRWMQT